MAGAIKNLLLRNGRYYARIVVPAKLRAAVGKSELGTPLGADRRTAIQHLPLSLSRLQSTLNDAALSIDRQKRPARRSLSDVQIAHLSYQVGLEDDDCARDEPPDEILGDPAP